jgi:hypothetical protein
VEISRRDLLSAPILLVPRICEARSSSKFSQLRLGAGGMLTGLSIGSDGTTVTRTDTYGAWIAHPRSTGWYQAVTAASMPSSADSGVAVEAVVAPSNPSVMYMLLTGTTNSAVYKSVDRGLTWKKGGLRLLGSIQVALPTKQSFPCMAVDPQNADICLAGTPDEGIFYTLNGGTSWAYIPNSIIPVCTTPSGASYPGGYLIAFDPTSPVAAGATQGIYVTSYGNGVYCTTGGTGGSWTKLNSSGMPTTHSKLLCDQFGNLWVVDGTGSGANFGYLNVYAHSGNTIFTGSAWTQITLPSGRSQDVCGIAVDPSQVTESNSRIFCCLNNTAQLAGSVNGGSTWFVNTNVSLGLNVAGITWIVNYLRTTEGVIGIAFDPSLPDTLCGVSGVDFWYCSPPSNGSSAFTWHDEGGNGTGETGIEQLVTNWIISPPGGNPVVCCWDHAFFPITNPSYYPATYGPTGAPIINHGSSADWASSAPSTLAGVSSVGAAVSTNGGGTFTTLKTQPSDGIYAGCIAASSATNWVWFPSNNGNPQYTTDGGSTWHSLGSYFNTKFGIPLQLQRTENGWGFAYYNNAQICCADRSNANTFYAYNYGPSSHPTLRGVYKSADGGATWTKVYSGKFDGNGGVWGQLRSVPGQAGHLFYSANGQTYRSINGGSLWSAVYPLSKTVCIGFGKARNGGYPAIYAVATIGGVYGVYGSDDSARTWNLLAKYPLDSLDRIKCIEGDSNTYGTCYVGFAGSGAGIYTL